MNLEDQVTSLELSKRLKELGVKQESLYAYVLSEFGTVNNESYENRIILTHSEISNSFNKWYAFTASELISLLPHRITLKEGAPFNSFTIYIKKSVIVTDAETDKPIIKYIYAINYECDATELTGEYAFLRRKLFAQNTWDENFSNTIAKTLIYLIENGLIKND